MRCGTSLKFGGWKWEVPKPYLPKVDCDHWPLPKRSGILSSQTIGGGIPEEIRETNLANHFSHQKRDGRDWLRLSITHDIVKPMGENWTSIQPGIQSSNPLTTFKNEAKSITGIQRKK